jgi:ATP-dependent exoDNAse (exonuclease V) beta subunit
VGVVRVMTVHKAKGLGFDVVVLPELEGKKLEHAREGLAVQRARDRSIEWVLNPPNKIFCDHDPVLAAHGRAAAAEAGYGELSLLYVAMTRAKRAMFAITKPPGKSTSQNLPRLLAATLGAESGSVRVGDRSFAGAWSSGDPEWHRGVTPPAEPTREPDTIAPVAAERAPRRVARRAASEASGVRDAARLFALDGGWAREFGRTVHALLAGVEWGGADAEKKLAAEWREHGAAGTAAIDCVRAPELAEVWHRKPGAELWRERAFELVLDGAWVTGVFDRVVVERDAAGRAVRATVFDFKTDAVASEADAQVAVARHAAQLSIYRRAVARLTGLEENGVGGRLVFTRLARCVAAGG